MHTGGCLSLLYANTDGLSGFGIFYPGQGPATQVDRKARLARGLCPGLIPHQGERHAFLKIFEPTVKRILGICMAKQGMVDRTHDFDSSAHGLTDLCRTIYRTFYLYPFLKGKRSPICVRSPTCDGIPMRMGMLYHLDLFSLAI